ncbi:hypothetical protein HNR44_002680 [Geomicrobium halophilum]|uniref:Uncharacterized protein n=1 Tax=Geomicrobium halophilum TaxID=549000 RepID=A0A841PPJ4_9BACL|nr:hypothetical protein [Geomicrobium halophilum]
MAAEIAAIIGFSGLMIGLSIVMALAFFGFSSKKDS